MDAFLPRRTFGLIVLLSLAAWGTASPAADEAEEALRKSGLRKGIFAVLGLPKADDPDFVVKLASGNELTVYFQSPEAAEELAVRQAAEKAGLLGKRIFAGRGPWDRIHLADNLAGAAWVSPAARDRVPRAELLRVLHPEGKAIVGPEEIVKPFPEGIDSWSQPFHGPDNNPQSKDRVARAPYATQFLAEPMFSPMPEVTVASGGRLFRAFGHIALLANQNPVLNTLMGINGYNGTILWRRPLREGFCIHRNTFIATPDTLYVGDDESCKMIDARTGEIRDQIVVPDGLGDGKVWKWRAAPSSTPSWAARRSGRRPPPRRSAAWGTGPGACGKATTTRSRRRASPSAGPSSPSTRPPGGSCGNTARRIPWTAAASA